MQNKPTSVKILLIRHGQAYHNIDNDYSLKDPTLTKLGIQQAKNIKFKLNPDIVYFSPLTRTIETTKYIFKNKDIKDIKKFIPHEDLQETYAGERPCDTGICTKSLQKNFPTFDFSNLRKKWFEPTVIQEKRVKNFLTFLSKELDKKTDVKCVVVVTHAGTIYRLTGKKVENCEIVECKFMVKTAKLIC
uniref:Histidine phosphatase superfamily protein n=1 Tax=Mimivirus LCMiAC01 TaxID=2506608 RepID=A0A481Z0C0_9VIRU|nr:MAG: histidine phosphatase superfamily protein [Mimivirus LCMiAC01]